MPSVLIIGDSHVHATPFGAKLEKKLKGLGWDVVRKGVGATSSRSWTNGNPCTPTKSTCYKVADLPRGMDLLVISLGTNDGANANVAKTDQTKYASEVAGRIVELARTFGAKRTLWVLPPWQRSTVKGYTQPAMEFIYEAAPQAEAEGVELFDSRPATEYLVKGGNGDGVHPGNAGGEAWATAVVKQIVEGKPRSTSSGPAASGMSTVLLGGGVALLAGLLLWRLSSR